MPFIGQIATSHRCYRCHSSNDRLNDFRYAGMPLQSALAPWIVQLVGTLPRPGVETTCVPFINQIDTSPAVLRHRMSLLPSPLKSPVSAIVQLVGTLPRCRPETTCVPFINQIATSPLALRHRMSVLPSPLKSPVPTMVQLVGTLPRPGSRPPARRL